MVSSQKSHDQEDFLDSLGTADQYPQNVVKHNTYQHTLESYKSLLDERKPVLFCAEGSASLDVWDYQDLLQDSNTSVLSSQAELRKVIEGNAVLDKKDPRCRIFFIHARHSRDRLKISHDMFLYMMTYHQVMPEFLEFVFPFGWQEYQDDFYFSGFRAEQRLLESERALNIPALDRSGRDYSLCYALKSVEKSGSESSPWSIRDTAIYHSFDIGSGKALWILVKGNALMRDRLQNTPRDFTINPPTKIGNLFSNMLKTNLMVCSWAAENWRWYINSLGRKLEDLTRHSLAIRITESRGVVYPPGAERAQISKAPSRKLTGKSMFSLSFPTSSRKQTFQSDVSMQSSRVNPRPQPPTLPEIPPPPPPPPGLSPTEGTFSSVPAKQPPAMEPEWSFHHFQEIQSVEDKLNTTVQVLEDNIKVIQDLKEFYEALMILPEMPKEIKVNSLQHVGRFSKKLSSIMNDLRMHKSRAETLIRLGSDRKTLLYGILEYRAMEANRLLAKRAQESADRMEHMTKEMNRLALKTKDETVSMKIITLVTLFYLPGTFISTIMSTDVVTFKSGQDGLQWPALSIWLKITIPLMFLTFIAWLVVYKGVEKGWFTRKRQVVDEKDGITLCE